VEGAFGATIGERGVYAIGRTGTGSELVHWVRRAELSWGDAKEPFAAVTLPIPGTTPIVAVGGTSKGIVLATGGAPAELVEYERNGSARVFTSVLSVQVEQIVADDGYAYCASSNGDLYRVSRSGGQPELLGRVDHNIPIHVTTSGVYWVGADGVWCVRALWAK
jgi:hypothetical protein